MTTDTTPGRPAAPAVPTTSRRGESAWRVVAGREIAVKLRDRNFLVSTLVTLGLILGAMALQIYLGSGSEKLTVATTGPNGGQVVELAVAAAKAADEDVEIVAKSLPGEAAVRSAVLADDVDAGLVPSGEGWQLLGRTDRNSTAATWIGAAVQQSAFAANAQAAGTSVAELSRNTEVEYTLLAPDDTPQDVVRGTTYVFGFLFYLAAVLLGVALATSIVEEKQNRIVEIIASTIRLRDLLIGKIVGNTLMAVAQMAIFAGAAVIALLAFGESGTLRQITPGLGWFLAFYAIGIAVLACVYAAAGAMASRTEDIQSTTTPATMGIAVVFIAGISASGTFAQVLSFLPLSSTFVMPGRLVAGDAAWWEPIAALLIALATAALVIGISERIYRRALMQTGGRLSMRQALKVQD